MFSPPYCPHKYAKKSARHQRSSADFSESLIKFFFFLNRLVSMFNSTVLLQSFLSIVHTT